MEPVFAHPIWISTGVLLIFAGIMLVSLGSAGQIPWSHCGGDTSIDRPQTLRRPAARPFR